MATFKDHFSEHADEYARYRPDYPPELFSDLATLVPAHDLAWDAGTGNGQAAVQLTAHFQHVVATDASRRQIEHAVQHPAITYHVAPSETVPLDDASVDLIIAAQAAHWFDLRGFYDEVRRVARSHGIIALITYALPHIHSTVDPFVYGYANQVVGSYWPPERAHIDAGYLTLPFPFEEHKPLSHDIMKEWTGRDFLNYLGTWSATRNYMRSHDSDPRESIAQELLELWGDDPRTVRWPIKMRIGRVHAPPDGDQRM